MTSHYDDPEFSYVSYWQDRDYEHQSEVTAILSLLDSLSFSSIADIGGGYGRLIPVLRKYSKKVLLVEPAQKQRRIATKMLSADKHVSILPGTANKTRLPDKSLPLVVMVRVMHHLPDPLSSLVELNRILKPNGLLILEFANSKHFKAQIQSFFSGKPILPVPTEKRSLSNIKKNTIPFVNHHPVMIQKLLKRSGFRVLTTLSVSNFRSPLLKRLIPHRLLITLEKYLQPHLAGCHYGPSIFILAQKISRPLDKIRTP